MFECLSFDPAWPLDPQLDRSSPSAPHKVPWLHYCTPPWAPLSPPWPRLARLSRDSRGSCATRASPARVFARLARTSWGEDTRVQLSRPRKVPKIDRNGRPGSRADRAAAKRERTGIILCSLDDSLLIPHHLWSVSSTAQWHKATTRPHSCISNCSDPSEQRDAKRIFPPFVSRF